MGSELVATLGVVAFLVGFPLFWIAICWVIALLGEWHALARTYVSEAPFEGVTFHMRSGRLGFSNYNGVLNVGINHHGMRLAVFPLFRVGHPPLFIPWQHIDAQLGRVLFFETVEFTFRGAPGVRLRVRRSFGDELLRHRPLAA